FLRNAIAFPVILFIGFDTSSVVVASAFTTVTAVFSHSRANFDFGWMNYLFSTNQLHRWHHSVIPAEADKNFGVGLIVWDLAFGTFYFPQDRSVPEENGLHAEHPYAPSSFFKVLTFPFHGNDQ
ncbi:MAG: sterol desaturase family protein, partial [Pseudobdellovibrionaceae bacterium]